MINLNYQNKLKSIIDYSPDFILTNGGNELAKDISKSLVSFIIPLPNSNTQYQSIGTGFILKYLDNKLYLCTANHVFKQVLKIGLNNCVLKFTWDNTENNKILLSHTIRLSKNNNDFYIDKSHFYIDEQRDYFLIELSEGFLSKMPTDCYIYFLTKKRLNDCGIIPTSSFLITGFPSNKNKFHKKRKGSSHIQTIVSHEAKYCNDTNDIYIYADKNAGKVEPDSAYSPVVKDFNPQGMSGSPLFQIYVNEEKNKYVAIFIGIFTEYRQTELRYKACILEDRRYELSNKK